MDRRARGLARLGQLNESCTEQNQIVSTTGGVCMKHFIALHYLLAIFSVTIATAQTTGKEMATSDLEQGNRLACRNLPKI